MSSLIVFKVSCPSHKVPSWTIYLYLSFLKLSNEFPLIVFKATCLSHKVPSWTIYLYLSFLKLSNEFPWYFSKRLALHTKYHTAYFTNANQQSDVSNCIAVFNVSILKWCCLMFLFSSFTLKIILFVPSFFGLVLIFDMKSPLCLWTFCITFLCNSLGPLCQLRFFLCSRLR